ncbi:MAG: hypothetical protein JXK16_12075 [Thiotrichales bacterium]|nr:hypothetical protein [Thiotrichales bacterium]
MANNRNLNHYKQIQQRDPSKMVNRGGERRGSDERRTDNRSSGWQVRSIKVWFKSIFKPRLGLDRRKSDRRASLGNGEYRSPRSLLTPEEIHHLLKN